MSLVTLLPRRTRHQPALAIIAAAAVLAPSTMWAQRERPVTWTVPDSTPCVGLTLGYAVPLAELQRLVGPGLRPARGPAPDVGLYLVFVAKCPASTVGGRPTGAFVTAHVLVPIEPPAHASRTEAAGVGGWITATETIGPNDAPVRRLFAATGFPTEDGAASLDVERGPGAIRARLTLTTARGRVTATATFGDSVVTLARTTGIVSPDTSGLVAGPEHSRRRSSVPGSVQVDGSLLPDGVHAGAPSAALDTRFAWRFTFVRDRCPAGRGAATSSAPAPGMRPTPR